MQSDFNSVHWSGWLHAGKLLPPPHSIDTHSWPCRCKNRWAEPELEMVTTCCLQLLRFLYDTGQSAKRNLRQREFRGAEQMSRFDGMKSSVHLEVLLAKSD